MSPKTYLHLESALGFIAIGIFYLYLDYSILLFFLLLFLPDVSMIGYVVNTKIGSILYNIGHTLIFPITLVLIAFLQQMPTLLMLTLIWTAHIFLDRSIGFGLKYNDGFKITHIQKIE